MLSGVESARAKSRKENQEKEKRRSRPTYVLVVSMSNVKTPFSALCLFGRYTNERGGGGSGIYLRHPPGLLSSKSCVRRPFYLVKRLSRVNTRVNNVVPKVHRTNASSHPTLSGNIRNHKPQLKQQEELEKEPMR